MRSERVESWEGEKYKSQSLSDKKWPSKWYLHFLAQKLNSIVVLKYTTFNFRLKRPFDKIERG